MKASIIPIGNSRGLRLPSALLKECNIGETVELLKEDDRIIIKPVRGRKRKGWDAAFKGMHERGEDSLLLDEALDRDLGDWQWK